MTRSRLVFTAARLLLVTACGSAEVTTDGTELQSEGSAATVALPPEGSPDAVGALRVANECAIGLGRLDGEAHLYATAAKAIVAARAGADTVCGTEDDRRFHTLAELLSVSGVGPVSVERLVIFANTTAFVPSYAGGTVEGVTFSDPQGYRAMTLANGGSLADLTAAGVRSDAARNILTARPLFSLEAVGLVARVGPAALACLRGPEAPAGFTITAEFVAGRAPIAKEAFWEDEGFMHDVVDIVGWNDDLIVSVVTGLEAEFDRQAPALIGRTFASEDLAAEAVSEVAGAIKGQVRTRGADYLRELGLIP